MICGEAKHPQAYACARCKRILDRVETRRGEGGQLRCFDRKSRIRALQSAWDPEARVFRCHYTGVELVTNDQRDHRYLSFEHQTPGDESELVVVSALINRMKSDLSDSEFRRLVGALAAHFEGRAFDENAFPARPLKRV